MPGHPFTHWTRTLATHRFMRLLRPAGPKWWSSCCAEVGSHPLCWQGCIHCGLLPCSEGSPAAALPAEAVGANAQPACATGISMFHQPTPNLPSTRIVPRTLRAGANPLQLDSTGRTPRQACLYKAAGGPLASILPSLPRPPMQHDQAALQRCVQLLKAAEAAAGPELQHARKAAAACAHCGGKDGLKRCNG